MNGWASSLIIGFLLGASSFWVISRLNDRYTKREENLSRLLLKRAKKD
jgi:NhaP-type Na+/H+ or K+/H+ antiporter